MICLQTKQIFQLNPQVRQLQQQVEKLQAQQGEELQPELTARRNGDDVDHCRTGAAVSWCGLS